MQKPPIAYQESDYTSLEAYVLNSGSIKPYESVEHDVRLWLLYWNRLGDYQKYSLPTCRL